MFLKLSDSLFICSLSHFLSSNLVVALEWKRYLQKVSVLCHCLIVSLEAQFAWQRPVLSVLLWNCGCLKLPHSCPLVIARSQAKPLSVQLPAPARLQPTAHHQSVSIFHFAAKEISASLIPPLPLIPLPCAHCLVLLFSFTVLLLSFVLEMKSTYCCLFDDSPPPATF